MRKRLILMNFSNLRIVLTIVAPKLSLKTCRPCQNQSSQTLKTNQSMNEQRTRPYSKDFLTSSKDLLNQLSIDTIMWSTKGLRELKKPFVRQLLSKAKCLQLSKTQMLAFSLMAYFLKSLHRQALRSLDSCSAKKCLCLKTKSK